MYIPKKKANRNEAETRADHIDPRLDYDGWERDSDSRIRREFEITKGRILVGGKRSQRLIADYVLIYKGQKLAVVEAKKEGLSYTEGVRQAKDYAERLQCRFAYSTNGHEIYQIDMVDPIIAVKIKSNYVLKGGHHRAAIVYILGYEKLPGVIVYSKLLWECRKWLAKIKRYLR